MMERALFLRRRWEKNYLPCLCEDALNDAGHPGGQTILKISCIRFKRWNSCPVWGPRRRVRPSSEIPVLSPGPGERSDLPWKFLSCLWAQKMGLPFRWNFCPVCEPRKRVRPSNKIPVLSVGPGKGSVLPVKFLSCLWAQEKGPPFQVQYCAL